MNGPVATCRGVHVRYGAVVALDGLDLELAAGEVTGLVGANGAGKTTTLRLLAGLVPRTAGAVAVLGRDPAREPLEVRRRLGLLPDRPALPPYLSVRELLHLRAGLWGLSASEAAVRADALLDRVGLVGLLDRPCSALSHGQAQRAALAAVLLPAPEVLLVDEPMTALDLPAQRLVGDALRAAATDGAAVVLTTHTVAHVSALADRVVALADGRVRASRPGTRDSRELEAWLLEQG